MTTSFYRVIDQWATEFMAVVPLSKGKPIGTRHLDLWGKVPTESRKSLFDADFRDKGGDGAALLTTGPKLRICFVDVDDPAKLDAVRRWLREKTGATYFAEVTTGRGAHIYFRMEDHEFYTSGKALKWGEFTDSRGTHACVDLRGEGSTAIMPGSIYDKRDRGGIRTTYRWGGRFGHLDFQLPPFEEFVAALPILPKAAWDEMAGERSSTGASDSVEVDWSSDPLWAKVDPNARGKQVCPVCGHETLTKGKIPGTMACFHDDCKGSAPARIYRPVDRTKKALEKEVEEYEARQSKPQVTPPYEPMTEVLIGSQGGVFEDAEDMAWQGFRADVLADVHVSADPDDILHGYDFSEGDPCHGLGPQALMAERLHGGRWTWSELTKCPSTATVTQSRYFPRLGQGTSRQIVPSCWRYSCGTCGPLLLKALKQAIRAWAWFKVGPQVTPPYEPMTEVLIGSQGGWCSAWITSAQFGQSDPMRHVLKRHAAKHPDDFHWLGLASTPSETQILIFWRGDAAPKKSSALWDLFDENAPLTGDQDEILSQALATIDLEAWYRARALEHESRIVLLLGPSKMQAEVKALHDWLTTHNRGPVKPALKKWEPSEEAQSPEPKKPTKTKKPKLAPEHKDLVGLLKKRQKLLEQEAKDHEWLVREFAKDAAKAAAEAAKKERRKTKISVALIDPKPYVQEIQRLLQDSKIKADDTGLLPVNTVQLLDEMLADGRVVARKPGHRKAKKLYMAEGRIVDLLID